MEKQLSVASSQLSVVAFSPEDGRRRLPEIDHKSLFRNTLPASYLESMLYMGPLKVLKTGNLRMILTLMQSILCRQSTHTKYFTGGGGGSRRSLRSPATAAVGFDESAAGHTSLENALVSAVAGKVGAVAFP